MLTSGCFANCWDGWLVNASSWSEISWDRCTKSNTKMLSCSWQPSNMHFTITLERRQVGKCSMLQKNALDSWYNWSFMNQPENLLTRQPNQTSDLTQGFLDDCSFVQGLYNLCWFTSNAVSQLLHKRLTVLICIQEITRFHLYLIES